MIMLFVFLAMSALQPIWADRKERLQQPLPGTQAVRGLFNKVDAGGACIARSRSPRRRTAGVKSLWKTWAKGENTAVAISRIAHGIVTEDGTDAGAGMARLAELGSASSGSEQNCTRKMMVPLGKQLFLNKNQ